MPPVYVCLCNGVTESTIRQAAQAGCRGVAELTMRTGCGATCGSCLPMAADLLDAERTASLALATRSALLELPRRLSSAA